MQPATQGVLDLRGYTKDNLPETQASGQWKFVWGELIDPKHESGDLELIEVPRSWNSQIVGGEELPADGYGSYVLDILFDDESDCDNDGGRNPGSKTCDCTHGSLILHCRRCWVIIWRP